MEKMFFGGYDLLKANVIEPTRMPRTIVIPVVREKKTGYLNAAPYSGGVTSINPLQILFGPKSPYAIETFQDASEYCIAVPGRHQVDQMWAMALAVPHGINEIEVAGCHDLQSRVIGAPGVEEFPLNIECRKIFFGKLPPPWRAILIGEAVSVSIDTDLLEMSRSEVVKLYPMHEAGDNPQTELYGPSVLSGELIPPSEPRAKRVSRKHERQEKKTYVRSANLYKPENERILMNAIFPRPSYIVMTADEKGLTHALPIAGGSLQATPPEVQVPVRKDTYAYEDIKRSGRFAVSIPNRSLIKNFESLEKDPDDLKAAGFSLLKPNVIEVPGVAECPISMDCKAVMFEDVPGTNYAILIGRKVGIVLDKEIATRWDSRNCPVRTQIAYTNEVYSSFIYAVMDCGMVRKWGFHDVKPLSVKPIPTWGSRYGGWWGGGLASWLVELCDYGPLTKEEHTKIRNALSLWNNGRPIPWIAEYIDDEAKNELQKRLTKLLNMMAWAHHDSDKWDEVHKCLAMFPEEPRHQHSGPVHHEKWCRHGS